MELKTRQLADAWGMLDVANSDLDAARTEHADELNTLWDELDPKAAEVNDVCTQPRSKAGEVDQVRDEVEQGPVCRGGPRGGARPRRFSRSPRSARSSSPRASGSTVSRLQIPLKTTRAAPRCPDGRCAGRAGARLCAAAARGVQDPAGRCQERRHPHTRDERRPPRSRHPTAGAGAHPRSGRPGQRARRPSRRERLAKPREHAPARAHCQPTTVPLGVRRSRPRARGARRSGCTSATSRGSRRISGWRRTR